MSSAEYQRQWRSDNYEKYRATARRHQDEKTASHRSIRDGFLAAQGGVCGVCGADDPGKSGWSLDHDHACCPTKSRKACGNCYRGALCNRCNVVTVPAAEMGALRFKQAQRYLERTTTWSG